MRDQTPQDFADRLHQLFNLRGWPERGRIPRLTRELGGVSEIAVRKWLKGDNYPELGRIIQIANLYQQDLSWLLTGIGYIAPPPAAPSSHIAHLTWAQAQAHSQGDAQWHSAAEPTQCNPFPHPQAFALTYPSDAMQSASGESIPAGARIVLHPATTPKAGAIMLLGQGDQLTLRKIIYDGGVWLLRPLNSQYPIQTLTPDIQIHALYLGAILPAHA
ncbi:MAG: S24 family peptidase [Aeromonas sp.]